jgi:hypothetical protein
MTSVSNWFVVFTNGAVLPTVVHFVYHKKYIFALQIGANAVFSCIHHAITTGLLPADESAADLFLVLDAVYSYLSILLFSLYFFMTPSPREWMLQMNLAQTMIVAVILYGNVDMAVFLSAVVVWILSTVFCHLSLLRPFCIYNPYLWITCMMMVGDLASFFLAISSAEFNWFHSAHHLFAFTLPLSVDCAVEWGDSVEWGDGIW